MVQCDGCGATEAPRDAKGWRSRCFERTDDLRLPEHWAEIQVDSAAPDLVCAVCCLKLPAWLVPLYALRDHGSALVAP